MGRPHATSSGVSPTITTSVPRNVRPVSALARAAATAGRSDRRDESEPYAPTRKRAGSSPADSSFSAAPTARLPRSEEHTSELQSRLHLVCRLLLEKKKNTNRSG